MACGWITPQTAHPYVPSRRTFALVDFVVSLVDLVVGMTGNGNGIHQQKNINQHGLRSNHSTSQYFLQSNQIQQILLTQTTAHFSSFQQVRGQISFVTMELEDFFLDALLYDQAVARQAVVLSDAERFIPCERWRENVSKMVV